MPVPPDLVFLDILFDLIGERTGDQPTLYRHAAQSACCETRDECDPDGIIHVLSF
jgi:hypothetical protein